MNLGMSVRAELFRARRMKLAVIIALMYLGIAGIYVFAGPAHGSPQGERASSLAFPPIRAIFSR